MQGLLVADIHTPIIDVEAERTRCQSSELPHKAKPQIEAGFQMHVSG